jgi:uncharacterized phage protein (TIGR02218 family)
MSFTIEEVSLESGSPIELYDIVIGSTTYYLCSCAEAITMDGNDYVPTPVSRDPVPVGIEERKSEISLSVPASHDFVRQYIHLVPASKATVTIRRFHRYDGALEVIKLFKGIVSAIRFIDSGANAVIGLVPYSSRLGVTIPRYVYSGLCNHVLGDRWCQIDLEAGLAVGGFSLKFVGNLSAISGINVTVDGIGTAGYPNNFFKSGILVTAAGDKRLITNQNVNNLRVLVPLFEGASLIGNNVAIYGGCDHSYEGARGCGPKFANKINYGGFPYIPRNNPFATGLT